MKVAVVNPAVPRSNFSENYPTGQSLPSGFCRVYYLRFRLGVFANSVEYSCDGARIKQDRRSEFRVGREL